MQNFGVISDIHWDNFILINNKFKKINPEQCRLHTIYSRTLEVINNCSNKNMLTLIRHYSDNLSKTIYNLLKICDLWIIFTNNIEFNTPARLIMEKCDEFGIKYIIVSEYSRDKDYYSFPINDKLSFKKIIIDILKIDIVIDEFNDTVYNDFFNIKNNDLIKLNFKNKIRETYKDIEQHRKERGIKLLYDKDELRTEKQAKKTIKEIKMIQFTNNKLNYYKKN
jgi:hypothetical protein